MPRGRAGGWAHTTRGRRAGRGGAARQRRGARERASGSVGHTKLGRARDDGMEDGGGEWARAVGARPGRVRSARRDGARLGWRGACGSGERRWRGME